MWCFVIQTMYFYPKQQILGCISLEQSNADLPPPSRYLFMLLPTLPKDLSRIIES